MSNNHEYTFDNQVMNIYIFAKGCVDILLNHKIIEIDEDFSDLYVCICRIIFYGCQFLV